MSYQCPGGRGSSEETSNSSLAVDYNSTRVTFGRKGAHILVAGHDGPLLGNPSIPARIILGVREYVVGLAHSKAGSPATFKDHDAVVASVVILGRVVHLVI